ncbi:MAG: hypothetical protein HOB37_12555 [Rhodospirillaceae bacterium]|nr:hypothetical protein [Rhodospirillaceae bacterium]
MIKGIFRAFLAWADRHWMEFFAVLAVALMLLVVMWPMIVYTIPAGSVGVMWYRFFDGTVTRRGSQLREGIHFILPWDKIFMYDARLQRIQETVRGLSIDGLNINVNMSSRFVIESKFAGFLHKSIGPNYADTLMRPQLRTLILTYISENEASDLYSTRREQLQTVVQSRFQAALANISTNVPFDESYIRLEDVLVEEIELPAFVSAAIEQKIRVRHMSEAYDFRLQLEEKERQRKKIEAEGVRSFQEIVAPGITESYLRWRGIEATLQLSQSNNSKIIIIGGADGLPIILNTDTTASAQKPSLHHGGHDPNTIPMGAGQGGSSKAAATPSGTTPSTGGGAPAGPNPPATPPERIGPLGPLSDFLQRPSPLIGPSPLTASGAALQQQIMSPPGVPASDAPNKYGIRPVVTTPKDPGQPPAK